MALPKRKTVPEVGNARPSKKHKPSISSSKSLVLKDEETFPRGGASVLTSLEHKQIQIQATEDALFEQRTGTKSARNDFGDEENDENLQEATFEAPVTSSKRGFSKNKPGNLVRAPREPCVRIEGLSYRVCFRVPKLFIS
jgi:rRNA biogenesis protein RRP5